jgi:hypothetical protein
VESTIERRASVPRQEHLPPSLLRLSVGIEAVEDLWADLDRALIKRLAWAVESYLLETSTEEPLGGTFDGLCRKLDSKPSYQQSARKRSSDCRRPPAAHFPREG